MTKRELRKQLRSARNAMEIREREVLSDQICARVCRLLEAVKPTCIHTYLPMGSEVDTWPIIVYAQKQLKIPVYVPHVVSTDRNQLQHVLLPDEPEIATGVLGTPTVLNPADIVSTSDLGAIVSARDMIVVPMLGFNAEGYRLGYGGGFYDVLLPNVVATAIGVAFESQRTNELEHEEHDVPLLTIITESQVHQCL